MKLELYGHYFKVAFWLIIIIETLSFLGHNLTLVNQVLFFLIIITTFLISLWRLEYGFWIASAELFIGSFGYLFFYDLGGFRLSVRLGVFLAVCSAWLIRALKDKQFPFKKTNLWRPWLLLLIALGWGVSAGLLHHNQAKNIFFDVNAYLYLALIVVAFSVLHSWQRVNQWLQILGAAVTTVALKTLFLLFYFSHETDETLLRLVYTWVRDTRVGEISLVTQNYYRIFFQSHIWSLFIVLFMLTLLVLSARGAWDKKNYRLIWLLASLSSLTLLVSFSRSFWLALGTSLVLLFAYGLIKRKLSWLRLAKIILIILLVVAVEIGLITFLVNVKLPGGKGGGISAASLIKERATETQEAAIGSRFQLLPPLLKKFSERPLLGSGFGTTVTYQTLDPRTKELNGGQYTSYSFEWGYLDLGIKMGLIGLLVYLFFIWKIVRNGWSILKRDDSRETRLLVRGLLLAVFALLLTHLTTPYLNHPLGILLLISVAAILQPQTIAPSLEIKK